MIFRKLTVQTVTFDNVDIESTRVSSRCKGALAHTSLRVTHDGVRELTAFSRELTAFIGYSQKKSTVEHYAFARWTGVVPDDKDVPALLELVEV